MYILIIETNQTVKPRNDDALAFYGIRVSDMIFTQEFVFAVIIILEVIRMRFDSNTIHMKIFELGFFSLLYNRFCELLKAFYRLCVHISILISRLTRVYIFSLSILC